MKFFFLTLSFSLAGFFSTALAGSNIQVSVGDQKACAVLSDKSLWCWGRQGAIIKSPVKSIFLSEKKINKVALSLSQSCVLTEAGQIWCWNAGSGPDEAVEIKGFGGIEIQKIALGSAHACASDRENHIWCWGSNPMGQLGQGDFGLKRVHPALVTGFPEVKLLKMEAGTSHTCALFADQTLWCWGGNGFGQLGIASQQNPFLPRQVVTPDVIGISDFSIFNDTNFAIFSDGSLGAWGSGSAGKFGSIRESYVYAAIPLSFVEDKRFARVSLGVSQVFAQTESGELFTWGKNNLGELALGLPVQKDKVVLPTLVSEKFKSGDLVLTQMSMGAFSGCAVIQQKSDYTERVKCWGNNDRGQLGLGHLRTMGDKAGETFDELPYLEFK